MKAVAEINNSEKNIFFLWFEFLCYSAAFIMNSKFAAQGYIIHFIHNFHRDIVVALHSVIDHAKALKPQDTFKSTENANFFKKNTTSLVIFPIEHNNAFPWLFNGAYIGKILLRVPIRHLASKTIGGWDICPVFSFIYNGAIYQ
ncbi:hypothetical protein ACJX0J_028471 [Zea mays]